MLKIDRITKSFTGITAVNNISLEIPKGESFGFLGPNGAGKTTTLRMIMNIIQPDKGKIYIDGVPSTHCDHRRVGYLPEERGIYQKAKVRDVVEYLAKLKSVPPQEAKERSENGLSVCIWKNWRIKRFLNSPRGISRKYNLLSR
ncbi:MAG: ATP-binding cassette domain-containing protein [Candidatus Marinimicrobia bacterium]|nr:ATP-binding cassette domain-containing protein [Candidatus Neomarinimicrobiota bacterium]